MARPTPAPRNKARKLNPTAVLLSSRAIESEIENISRHRQRQNRMFQIQIEQFMASPFNSSDGDGRGRAYIASDYNSNNNERIRQSSATTEQHESIFIERESTEVS